MAKWPKDFASVEAMQERERERRRIEMQKQYAADPSKWQPKYNVSGRGLLFGCLAVVAVIAFVLWKVLG